VGRRGCCCVRFNLSYGAKRVLLFRAVYSYHIHGGAVSNLLNKMNEAVFLRYCMYASYMV